MQEGDDNQPKLNLTSEGIPAQDSAAAAFLFNNDAEDSAAAAFLFNNDAEDSAAAAFLFNGGAEDSTAADFLFNGEPCYNNTSIGSTSHEYWASCNDNSIGIREEDWPSYYDIARYLSEVELPSPSPSSMQLPESCSLDDNIDFHQGQSSGTEMIDEINKVNLLPASCSLDNTDFHQGQSSGTKMIDDQINIAAVNEIEPEEELKDLNEEIQEPRKKRPRLSPSREVRHETKQKETTSIPIDRMSGVPEKIQVIKSLIPHCRQQEQGPILDDAIKYISNLQSQLQMMKEMSKGGGSMGQGVYMTSQIPAAAYNYMPSQIPAAAAYNYMPSQIPPEAAAAAYNYHNFMMMMKRQMMQGPYYNSFPAASYLSCFGGAHLAPPTRLMGRLGMKLPLPPLQQSPSHSVKSTSSTAAAAGAAAKSTGSQVGYGNPSQTQYPYHMPFTTQ